METNKINFTKVTLDSLQKPPLGKRAYYYDLKTRGLGISLTSNGTKTFIVYRRFSGKPERVTLGRYPDLSIEQARKMAAEVNASAARGENPNEKRRLARSETTLKEFFDDYLERYAKHYKKSWREDAAQFKRYLSLWSQRKLSSIRKQDIQRLHHSIGKDKGIYSANRLLALLSMLFNKATEYGIWDKSNPASGIKKFKEKSRARFLQSDELPRFFTALLEEPNSDIRDYLLISLLTGARKTNVLSMRWSNINLERAEWYIPETKNGEPQTIALSREVFNLLSNRKTDASSDYVFASHSKLGHLTDPKSGWKRILKRANIEDLRIHDLRRTLGSWQAKTGASLSIIGKSLNHKSLQSTAIYARLDLEPVRESIERATKAMLSAAQLIKADK